MSKEGQDYILQGERIGEHQRLEWDREHKRFLVVNFIGGFAGQQHHKYQPRTVVEIPYEAIRWALTRIEAQDGTPSFPQGRGVSSQRRLCGQITRENDTTEGPQAMKLGACERLRR